MIDQFHGIPFFTPLYIKEKKLAFIHEVTKEVWRLNSWSWPFNIIPFVVGTVFEPLVFRLFYRGIPFFTVSESTKKELTEWGIPNKNVTVIYNGSDASGIKKIPPKDKKKAIMFLGALSKDKGIEDALKTFSILNCGNEEYNFWVVGKGELHYLNYLKRLTKNLGIDKKVKFWGFVSETKKFELLARASILINPSIREGWGLVVIEAASVGTPTVGYNVAGLRDSIIDQRTGFISETTPKALSEKLVVLLQNKLLYRKMSVNCIKWAKSLNWRKSARQSLKLLEDLAEEDK